MDTGSILVVEGDISQPKEICKSLVNFSNYFTIASENYAPYNLANKTKIESKETVACNTFCDLENQVIIMPITVNTEIGYTKRAI